MLGQIVLKGSYSGRKRRGLWLIGPSTTRSPFRHRLASSRRPLVAKQPPDCAAAEADGGGPEARPLQDYDYFLFDPSVAASPAPAPDEAAASSSGADGDHLLFIRGNRIIWSNGSRVHKRYAFPKTVIMACWCRMEALSDALLCVLQVDTLSIYDVTCEVVSIPLPYAVSSIWSLPFSILLQKSSDGSRMVALYIINMMW
ncbi:hypothetical protein ZWY2020_048600 [Hordeum vulgare]|nr:hypothetical protein ZWY2020_048600 [Hordeum vulgare]